VTTPAALEPPGLLGDRVPRTRALAREHPIGVVWLGIALFSTGPVMVASASISGVAFSFWRLWFGVGVLVLAAGVHRAVTGIRTSRLGWGWALACGVMFAAHQLMFMTALRATSVVDVTLMNTVAPIVVGILAVPAFGEHPGARFRLWSLVAMAGAAGIALVGSTGPEGDPLGMLLAAGNVVFYALYFVGSKLARPHIEPIRFLFGNAIAAALAVSAFVLLAGEAVRPVTAHDLLLCLGVAALPGAIGHLSVTWALRWVPANLPPVMMLSIPALSGALAWVVVDQAISAAQLAAGVVTLMGVAGAVRSPSARRLGADEALVHAEET
jgi:drug/metabolite transporter (DMT)-like permease